MKGPFISNWQNRCEKLVQSIAGAVALLILPMEASAHPHVFIEANVEIVRNAEGKATDIRHVWRFDEFFTASLVLDFDDNGNGILDQEDLQTIADETKASLADYNYYTEIRNGEEVVGFYAPDPYLVDYQDGQLIIILSLQLQNPTLVGPKGFKVAVSDPTYYVAVELMDEKSITFVGNDLGCSSEIIRPDFDALYAEDAERIAKLLDAAPDEEVEASDDYLTWINLECSS